MRCLPIKLANLVPVNKSEPDFLTASMTAQGAERRYGLAYKIHDVEEL